MARYGSVSFGMTILLIMTGMILQRQLNEISRSDSITYFMVLTRLSDEV